jgi:hypothetical protein
MQSIDTPAPSAVAEPNGSSVPIPPQQGGGVGGGGGGGGRFHQFSDLALHSEWLL